MGLFGLDDKKFCDVIMDLNEVTCERKERNYNAAEAVIRMVQQKLDEKILEIFYWCEVLGRDTWGIAHMLEISEGYADTACVKCKRIFRMDLFKRMIEYGVDVNDACYSIDYVELLSKYNPSLGIKYQESSCTAANNMKWVMRRRAIAEFLPSGKLVHAIPFASYCQHHIVTLSDLVDSWKNGSLEDLVGVRGHGKVTVEEAKRIAQRCSMYSDVYGDIHEFSKPSSNSGSHLLDFDFECSDEATSDISTGAIIDGLPAGSRELYNLMCYPVTRYYSVDGYSLRETVKSVAGLDLNEYIDKGWRGKRFCILKNYNQDVYVMDTVAESCLVWGARKEPAFRCLKFDLFECGRNDEGKHNFCEEFINELVADLKGETVSMEHPNYVLQKKYCEEEGYPLFAPKNTCPNCDGKIWEHISKSDAGSKLITGCPICHYSYCN